MIKEISEQEAFKLAEGADEFPVLVKEENDGSESAVCLKKFPTGFILGVSCDTKEVFKLYYSEDYDELFDKCEYYLEIMRKKGHPFEDLD